MSIPALLLALCATLSTFAGGFAARRFRDRLHILLGLAAGMLLGAALFDLLPEALALGHDAGLPPLFIMAVVAGGFLGFHLLETFLTAHAHDDPAAGGVRSSRFAGAAALAVTMHSMLDGAAIGLAFQASHAAGIVVAAAIIAHDFSDGLNTVMLLRNASPRQAMAWLVADSIAPCAGAVAVQLVSLSRNALAPLLAGFTGAFLYLGAAHLLPEARHHHAQAAVVAATALGLAVLFFVVLAAGGG